MRRRRPRRRRGCADRAPSRRAGSELSRSTIVVGSPRELRIVLGVELLRGRIDVGRVDVVVDACRAPGCGDASAMSVATSISSSTCVEISSSSASVAMPCSSRYAGKASQRIARGVGLALGRRTVVHFVVGQRVGVGPDHLGVHERRTLALAGVVVRLEHHVVRGERIAAVDFLDEQVGKRSHQLRDRAAGVSAPRPAPRSRSRCPRSGRRSAA